MDNQDMCRECGQSFCYELCPDCSGSGGDGDWRCSECGGMGEVLVCDCYWEARGRLMNDPAWYG